MLILFMKGEFKMNKNKFGEFLELLRLEANIKSKEIAEKLKMNLSDYFNVELGLLKMSQEQFLKACKLLVTNDKEKERFTKLYEESLKED